MSQNRPLPPSGVPIVIDVPSSAALLRRRRIRRIFGIVAIIAVFVIAFAWWYNHRLPVEMTEIFRGVTYTCTRLPKGPEGSGLEHVVEVDLTAPGIDLYTTPLDGDAVANGWEYRLTYATRVARANHLAVVINGTLFSHEPGFFSTAGDSARGFETVVSEHVVNHVNEHTYLLWFEDDLTPHLEKTKPPSEGVLKRAKWAIGGQGVIISDGKSNDPFLHGVPDERTAIGIDSARKRLWLVVFENASQRLVARELVRLGVRDAIMLDGGGSTVMALGPGVAHVRGGALMGNWRPVATFFGVRAQTIEPTR